MYPGVGFVVWQNEADLPEELIFHVNYLGGDMPTFTLNFSRPGNQIVGQYYNFIRLGRSGYTRVMTHGCVLDASVKPFIRLRLSEGSNREQKHLFRNCGPPINRSCWGPRPTSLLCRVRPPSPTASVAVKRGQP